MGKKSPIWALGLMSGTSLDGVDGALVRTDGDGVSALGESAFRPYSAGEQDILRDALGKWQGADLAAAHRVIMDAHAEVIAQFPNAELIGFHGQTLAHDAAGGRTHQLGDGAALAARVGKPVVWDFRTEDMRAGGQGAPLAPFFHFALGRWLGRAAPLAFVNLGGVGNVSWVNPNAPAPDDGGALVAFDTGPANAPMNDLVYARRKGNKDGGYDKGGAMALRGRADVGVVAKVLARPYFHAPPPKSLDRDDFADLLDLLKNMTEADALATLCAVCAGGVAKGATAFPEPVTEWIICGGGRHNAALMTALRDALPSADIKPSEAVGLNGDMIEAYAFGYLAVRKARGMVLSSPQTTGRTMNDER